MAINNSCTEQKNQQQTFSVIFARCSMKMGKQNVVAKFVTAISA